MGATTTNYLLTLHPTFTQGLVIGQLSILVLVYLVLKYLFLDSTQYPVDTSSYHPAIDNDLAWKKQNISQLRKDFSNPPKPGTESAEWFNAVVQQVMSIYRARLCDGLSGLEGEEIARRRIEDYANRIRPTGFLDRIKIHSVNLGSSSPRFSNARTSRTAPAETELDIEYTDDVSISLSTSYLFNYPMQSFARLPISLTISLAVFQATMTCVPPEPNSSAPALSISMSPTFTLNLCTESLMGSRAKLANVPKLHELIQHQVRRILSNRGTLGWKIPLPGLVGVAEVKEEVVKEIIKEEEEAQTF